eukprot:TRINITY_DN1908_c0_g1_i2.p1 TRINITY_DN1908_c0_g1~~TRINITY_DN1908_c0_g1_i2.p1  ORF type:complete len:125 (-),score=24.39 TRINITY_DN1908_c0_g1_i2:109-483(-)
MSRTAHQATSLIEVALREPSKTVQRKQFNLLELCSSLENWGVGRNYYRKIWEYYPDTYFTVSRIVLTKMDPDRKRGKCYGYWTWKGKKDEKEQLIRSVLKREWILHSSTPLPSVPLITPVRILA